MLKILNLFLHKIKQTSILR